MEPLRIESAPDAPEIIFDPGQNLFEISGRSYPEDTYEFYAPVLEWIDAYTANPNPTTVFTFKLQYFNSSSYKPIFDMLSKLEQIKQSGAEVQVQWHFKEGDWDMKEAGEEFSEIIELPFSFHTL